MLLDSNPGARLPKIVYIMGTARSGSTILSLLLGTDPCVLTAGELTDIASDGFVDNKTCSCGRETSACDLWGGVIKSLGMTKEAFKDAARINKTVDWHDGFFKQLFRILPDEVKRRYKASNLKLLSALKKESGCPVIVDSSKYAGRATALEKIAGMDVRVICLTRSPQGLVHSFQKPNKLEQKPKSTLSVLAYYCVTLISFKAASFFLKNKILYLSYEELLESPVSSLERIQSWTGLDLTESIRKIKRKEPFKVGHLVTANRLRKQKNIKFNPTLSITRRVSPVDLPLIKIMNLFGRCLGFIKNRKKVFMVGPSSRGSGGIASVLSIYDKRLSKDLNLHFIPTYSSESRISTGVYFLLSLIRIFYRCVFERDCLFHFHVASKGSFLRKSILAHICFFFYKPVIFHIHGGMFDQFVENASPLMRKYILGTLNRVDRLIVLSDSWKLFFKKYVPEKKIEVIHNPSSTFKTEIKKTISPVSRLLFMGKICERKGIYDLINALSRIKDENFILQVFGSGEVEKAVNHVKEKNMEDKIKVNGWVPRKEIDSVYKNADILVLPSYIEGLPMSILEAIGNGLCVVASNIGGIPEAVIDGYNGHLVEPGDIDQLSAKLQRLVSDKGRQEQMGMNSHKLAEEKFQISGIRKQLKRVYQHLSI